MALLAAERAGYVFNDSGKKSPTITKPIKANMSHRCRLRSCSLLQVDKDTIPIEVRNPIRFSLVKTSVSK